jgi:hypothetical protein
MYCYTKFLPVVQLSALESPDCMSLPVATTARTWAVGRVYGTAINEPTGSGTNLKVPIHVRVWLASPPRGGLTWESGSDMFII